ncbi:MAG: RNA methyltransferase [bacterium]|nr:RNA methyltransferase [bacterium]
MEKITSAQNPLIKKLVRLNEKQSFRSREGLTILDGVHLCSEYFSKIGVPEICVVAENSKSQEVSEIIEKCRSAGVKTVEITQSLFRKISPVIDGVGIVFVAKTPQSQGPIETQKETLILENIQDPGNLGTILRSAAAFGVEQIICSRGAVSAWSPKVLRAGMGAHFSLQIFEDRDLAQDIQLIDVPIFATSLEAKKSIFEEDLSGSKAWIFGNEGKGVSKEILDLADKKVIIPHDPKVESLNVAMAASVCLSEAWRQKDAK